MFVNCAYKQKLILTDKDITDEKSHTSVKKNNLSKTGIDSLIL